MQDATAALCLPKLLPAFQSTGLSDRLLIMAISHLCCTLHLHNRYAGIDVLLRSGYSQVVNTLGHGLQDARCGWSVIAVQHAPGHVAVTCEHSTAHQPGMPVASGFSASSGCLSSAPSTVLHTITAKRAVITLPLGVLKAGTVQFEPPLAQADPGKQAAVDALGSALYNKVGAHNLVHKLTTSHSKCITPNQVLQL